MDNRHHDAIVARPEFQTFLRKRRALVWPLLLTIIGAYFAFILFIAFDPATLGMPIAGSVISVGIVAGLGLILLTFMVTTIYVRRANRDFQPLIDAIATHVGEKPNA